MKQTSHQRIYRVVRQIPRGRVTTYGTVARLAGLAGQARLVGYALSALQTGTAVPWHRVINAKGEVSLRNPLSGSGAALTQRMRLERERVRFDAAGRVSLERFGWKTKPAGRR